MTEPEQPVVAVPLRAAAEEVLRARAAYVDAVNGQGHPGEPHDDALYTEGQGFRSPSTDCSRCGGAEYGSEDDLSRSYEALRAALAVEAVRPETDIDEERLARALHESDAAGCSSVDRPGEHTVEPHSFDFEDAKRLAAAYRATPTERPE